MLIFEYRCNDCKNTFEVVQYNNEQVDMSCPKCKSSDTVRLYYLSDFKINSSNNSH